LLFTVKKTQPVEPTKLERVIDNLLDVMLNTDPKSEEFLKMADLLVKLYKLKEVDINATAKKRVSPDTVAIIWANLIGIAAVIGYERAGHVVTSRAFGLVTKLAR
jgi:hypothetical protein